MVISLGVMVNWSRGGVMASRLAGIGKNPKICSRCASAIALAQVRWRRFHLGMGDARETESRWRGIGEVLVWVVFYFWAVWIFNALLPPRPEQTPFESYLKNKVWEQNYGDAVSDSDQRPDDGSVGQNHRSLLHRHQ